RHRQVLRLMEGVPLAVQLDRLVVVLAVERDLDVANPREAVLETDRRALIDAEQAAGLIAEVAAPQVAVEAMRELEVRFVLGQPQRRRQVDDAVIGLGRLQRRIVVVGLYWLSSGLRERRDGNTENQDKSEKQTCDHESCRQQSRDQQSAAHDSS